MDLPGEGLAVSTSCRVLSFTLRNAVRITNNRVNDLKMKYLLLLAEKMRNSSGRLNKIQIGF